MTGSFLFVKPSDPEGRRGTAYSGESPRYPYDHASWEWLLERALRRTLLPWALTKSHSRVLLRGHEDKYSMHRWGSYGEIYDASVLPREYNGISQGAYGKKTDADLSRGDRETPLPESWNSGTGSPAYSVGTKVTYGIVDLEDAVARLPFSLEWLPPGWSPAALDAWDLSASTTETTQGSAPATSGALDWTWRTTVTHVPYTIPSEPPFKCLSHMRTDDPTVTVNITNDGNETIAVETARTTLSAPRTSYGSVRDYHGTQVRECSYGAALGAGWALSEFYILHRHGLDYGPSTSSAAYGRDGRTAESYAADDSTLGCLVDIPDKDSGNVMVRRLANDRGAGFAHDVDWGGRQTWWHANDFPKGLDSVLPEKLRAQLNALCNVCQPAIPPAIPAFRNKFPDPGTVPWSHLPATLSMYEMYPQVWMRHLALACTPVDMSARLDAMTTTVHRVPALFAKIRTVTTEYSTSRRDDIHTYRDGTVSKSWEASTDRKVVTVEGTSTDPIPAGDALTSVSGQNSGVAHIHTTSTDSSGSDNHSDKTVYTWEEGFESDSEFLVCLRSTDNTSLSTKTTTKTSSTDESSYDDPSSSESETSDGNLPDSYDPDPDDLLFPDWVLPWIETAELFASIESRLGRTNGSDSTTSSIRYRPREGADTYSQSGSGRGTRTHKVRRKIVSLGRMDTSTGRFPAVDAAAIVHDVDPDAVEPTGGPAIKSSDSTTTTTTDSSYNITERTVLAIKDNIGNYRSRSVSYYVVVKWKFDRTDPETLETESPLADLYRKLADAKKALSDKRRELSDAQSALSSARLDLQSSEAALSDAQDRLDDPAGAEASLRSEAQAALDAANQALSDAQSEKSSAQSDYAAAEGDMRSAESSLQSAQAAYDAAVESGEGVEEAQAALESAYTAYYEAVEAYGEASSRLAGAEAGETTAQMAADAAQDYYDTLHDKIGEILQKAVDDAQAAVDEATSRVEGWTQKAEDAEDAIPDLEAAAAAAEQAIRDAGGVVP